PGEKQGDRPAPLPPRGADARVETRQARSGRARSLAPVPPGSTARRVEGRSDARRRSPPWPGRSRRGPRKRYGRRASSPTIRRAVDALELAQQSGPLLAGLDEATGAVHAETLLDGLGLRGFGQRLKLTASGQRVDLNTARGFDAIHPHERFADGLADRHQSVIAEDQDPLVGEIVHDAGPLAGVERRALEVMVG